MELRELATEELPELIDLYKHLHESDSELPAEDEIKLIWNEIESNSSIKYFGVFISGRLVSSCTITVVPNLTRGCKPYALIENVVTHESFRRKGFGKAVLDAALKFAWERGCYKVMLMTGRLDEETFVFYESAGFDRHAKQAFVAKPTGT
ncbi:MAG: GNAT family N-acetyltransferase [Pseudomonadales bacterium]|nr:GNAT family N-acetyltransferase [Pseudomonadales bacterium]